MSNFNVNCEKKTSTSTSLTTYLKLGKSEVWRFSGFLFEKFPFNFKSQKCCKNYQKMTSSVNCDKKPHTPDSSHTLTAIQANTTTTILSRNLKLQQQPKNVLIRQKTQRKCWHDEQTRRKLKCKKFLQCFSWGPFYDQ